MIHIKKTKINMLKEQKEFVWHKIDIERYCERPTNLLKKSIIKKLVDKFVEDKAYIYLPNVGK